MSTVLAPLDAPLSGACPVPDLIDRDGVLDAEELRALAHRIVADPDRWAHLVEHREDRRTYVRLHEDEHVTVWLLCWTPGQDTGFHDHDASSAGVAVARGGVVDERLTLGGPSVSRRLGRGGSTVLGPSEIHRMRHDGGAPAVSVHAYSPPLVRTGAYEVADDGRLLRHAQPGEDDLSPVQDAGSPVS